MPQAGQLLQVDGSRHRWLGAEGPFLTLVGAIDDATGIVTAGTFREQEDAAGYFTILAATARSHGRPVAVYSDRHTIFVAERPRAGPRWPSSSRAGSRAPRWGVRSSRPASAGSAPAARRPRAASSASGAPSRTAS